MPDAKGYRIVKLASGAHSVHSLAEGETFHPVVGPVAEAEALYVRQTKLVERLERTDGEFVVWDVGLGAAANPVVVLQAAGRISCAIRIVSFDHTLEPLRFALGQTGHLPYLAGYQVELQELLESRQVAFEKGLQKVRWEVHVSDFPALLISSEAETFPKPHLILFDAFSPAKNPAMWTKPLFRNVFRLLDPSRGCVLPTYSRSTLLRVTLLLAGLYVGVGHPTGEKEETTVAANVLELIDEPLDARWLQRALRSSSAEPLETAAYSQAPLSQESRRGLQCHPQFQHLPNLPIVKSTGLG